MEKTFCDSIIMLRFSEIKLAKEDFQLKERTILSI